MNDDIQKITGLLGIEKYMVNLFLNHKFYRENYKCKTIISVFLTRVVSCENIAENRYFILYAEKCSYQFSAKILIIFLQRSNMWIIIFCKNKQKNIFLQKFVIPQKSMI